MLPALSLSTGRQKRPTRCSQWSPSICSATCLPFPLSPAAHMACLPLTWMPEPETREPETRLPASLIGPRSLVAHTGYQTGKHSGNRSHSLSRQQGEEQHDLTLPAQNETGKRLPDPGRGGRGGDWAGTRRPDDEAPMWGTGGTPASLHVHTTRLCWTALAASTSKKSPGEELAG